MIAPMKLNTCCNIVCVVLAASLPANQGTPNIRPSEEEGDLAVPQREDEEISLEQEDLIETEDQQMEDPFVPNRFRNERPGHNALLVVFFSLLLFAGGLVAVNANRGVNPN